MKKLLLIVLIGCIFESCQTKKNVKDPIAEKACSLNTSYIGATLDEQDRTIIQQKSPKTLSRIDRGEPITVNDVIQLSQAGVSEAVILRYMKETKAVYQLNQVQIRRLQQNGVSHKIINFMINTQ